MKRITRIKNFEYEFYYSMINITLIIPILYILVVLAIRIQTKKSQSIKLLNISYLLEDTHSDVFNHHILSRGVLCLL